MDRLRDYYEIMKKELYRIRCKESGVTIAENVLLANHFLDQLIGLIGRKTLKRIQGLWLSPCNGIHTFGMRIPLDVIVLDDKGKILAVVKHLNPWRALMPTRGGCSVIELVAGNLSDKKISVGMTLQFEKM